MGILVNKLYGKTSSMTTVAQAKAVYKGSLKVYKMYAGSTLVWHEDDNDEPDIPDIPDEPDTPTESVTYGVPVTISVNYSDIAANGEGGAITINWEQTKNTYQGNALISTETLQGTSVASTVSGREQVSGSGYADGKLYAPNCGVVSSDRRMVYKINLITYIANGISASITTEYEVYQEANVVESRIPQGEPSITLSGDTDTNIPTDGGTFTFDVSCTSVDKMTYTSGYEVTTTNDETATLSVNSVNNATLNKNFVTGYGSVTGTVGHNALAIVNNIRIVATSGNTSKEITFKQSPSNYELLLHSLTSNAPAEGGNASFVVKSTKNDNSYPISTSNVSVTGLSGASILDVTQNSEDSTLYHVRVNMPENTATSTRTAIVTITHPSPSLETLTVTVTQNAAADDPIGGAVTINGTNSLGIVQYSMTVSSGVYDSLEIRAASGYSTSATVYDSVTKENVSSGTYKGTLKGVPTSGSVWILVLHKGSIIANTVAMAPEDSLEPIG